MGQKTCSPHIRVPIYRYVRVPSPRLFGFHPAKKRPVQTASSPAEPEPEHHRIIHMLAYRLFHHRRDDLPVSAAWGLSPIEKYVDNRLDELDG